MKSISCIFLMAAFITGAFFPDTVRAESKADTCLGPPEMCLDTPRIKETLVLDNQTILFKILGGNIYLNRLPFPCTGLKIANGFAYETSIAKLCKQDIITVLSPGSATGGKCGLGDFLPFNYEGESKDAVKLLKDSLLEELVEVGAFEDIYSRGE